MSARSLHTERAIDTLVVSRTCLHLLGRVVTALRKRPEIQVVLDRRYRERRRGRRSVTTERRRGDRRRGMYWLLN